MYTGTNLLCSFIIDPVTYLKAIDSVVFFCRNEKKLIKSLWITADEPFMM